MTQQGWLLAAGILLRCAFNVAVLATCTYVVFWRDASGWWFLLALLLCSTGGRSK
jgi:hypothetical protein